MKSEELRVGNLIEWEDDSHDIVRVTGILSYDDLDKADVIHYKETNRDERGAAMLFEFIPIPLTEEWLLKFGFRTIQKDFAKKGLILHNRRRGFVVRKSIPVVKSVHQLQNLYFALTGEELTIKEGKDKVLNDDPERERPAN